MGRKSHSKNFKSLIAILLVVIMVLGVSASLVSVAFAKSVYTEETYASSVYGRLDVNRSKEAETKNADIVIEGNIGYDGKYCIESVTPIRISVKNNGSTPLKGSVEIKVYVSQYEDDKNEYVSFSKSIEVSSGDECEVYTEAYIPFAYAYHLVSVKDEEGNVIKSKNILSEPVAFLNGICVVVDSEESSKEALKGLEYISDSYSYSVNPTAFVKPFEISSDEKMFAAFSCIIFRNGAYFELDDEQKDAVLSYVKGGGTVIADFIDGIETEDFNESFDSADLGKGAVYIEKMGFNPADEVLAYKSVPVERNAEYDRMEYRTTLSPSLETDVIKATLALLVIYAVVVIPGIYVVLKKLDKREKAIFVIPLSAVAMFFAVTAVGSTSGYKNGIIGITSRFEIEDEKGEGVTYAAFKTADTGEIALESDFKLVPYKVEPYNNYKTNGTGDVEIAVINDSEKTDIDTVTSKSWSTLLMRADVTLDLGDGVETDFYMENNTVKGTVKNNTPIDLEDVCVVAFNTGEKIDLLKAGESEQIEIVLEDNGYTSVVYELFGTEATRRQITQKYGKDIDKTEGFRIMNRIRYVDLELQAVTENARATENDISIIAFNGEDVLGSSFKANGKELASYNENMFVKEDKISYAEGSYVLPYGSLLPVSIESDETDYGYSYISSYLYDLGEDIIFTYRVPDRETVSEFSVRLGNSEKESALMELEEVYVLNNLNGEYEAVKEEYTNPQNYIDSDGFIKLKTVVRLEGEYSNPLIEVKGGGK